MITCDTSEVLKAGHGICFAKSHLLSALLYGLNGVYIKELKSCFRQNHASSISAV